MKRQSVSRNMVAMLESTRAPHLWGQIGFGIILFAFALAVVNSLLPEPSRMVGILLQPLIFVGIGGLLYHIGQHVHVLHKGAIHMAMMSSEKLSEGEH